jgi:hypothetical protein
MPRGGKREGSGRKKTRLSSSGKLRRVDAEEILASSDEKEDWLALLQATTTTSVVVVHVSEDGKPQGESSREVISVPDNKIRLEARKYLTDRRDGKAPQAVHHSGEEGGPVEFLVRHIGGRQIPNPARN